MATGMGETLHRSPRNAECFRIKRRAFRLVPPGGGLLVRFYANHFLPPIAVVAVVIRRPSQSEQVASLKNGFT